MAKLCLPNLENPEMKRVKDLLNLASFEYSEQPVEEMISPPHSEQVKLWLLPPGLADSLLIIPANPAENQTMTNLENYRPNRLNRKTLTQITEQTFALTLPAADSQDWFSLPEQAKFLQTIDRFLHPKPHHLLFLFNHRAEPGRQINRTVYATLLATVLATQKNNGLLFYETPPPWGRIAPGEYNRLNRTETGFLAHTLKTAFPSDETGNFSVTVNNGHTTLPNWANLYPALSRAFNWTIIVADTAEQAKAWQAVAKSIIPNYSDPPIYRKTPPAPRVFPQFRRTKYLTDAGVNPACGLTRRQKTFLRNWWSTLTNNLPTPDPISFQQAINRG